MTIAARSVELDFQNEWIVAWRDGEPVAMSPDLICVLDSVTGEAVGTETIRYGQRVTVIALPPPPVFLTAEGAAACRPARLRLRPRLPAGVRMRRIGIDVGGTNTDAVLIEEGRVRAAVKAPTTPDVTGGILDALARLHGNRRRRRQARRCRHDRHDPFHQRRRAAALLEPGRRDPHRPAGERRAAAVLRLAGGPRRGWSRAMSRWSKAGMNMTAARFMPLDRAALRDAARRIGDRGIRSVAIAAIFSPLDPGHEREAAAIVGEEIPGCAVTCSADLGRIGLLERENAALLNAALADLARHHGRGVRAGDRRFRHFGAAVHHPERRHGRRGRPGHAAAGL